VRKVVFAIIVALMVSLVGVTWTVSGAPAINVTVDGKAVNFPDAKPFIDANGRTLLPVRFVTEALGAKVEWKEAVREVYITKERIKISLRVDDSDIVVDNVRMTMDTKAIISESRTFVPIRYIAEGLGAKVGWDDVTKTVIITTVAQKSYDKDFYRINPEMPEELYTYEYKKRSSDNWYATNNWLVNRYGLNKMINWMNLAKDYIETCYTVDYRTLNQNDYVKNLKWYFQPGQSWHDAEGIERAIEDHLGYWAGMVKQKKIVMKAKYITDPSLIVSNGDTLVRGRVVYTIESCNDMEWLNKFLPFGKSEIGKEHMCDIDIQLANVEKKSGWDHSLVVVNKNSLLSKIK